HQRHRRLRRRPPRRSETARDQGAGQPGQGCTLSLHFCWLLFRILLPYSLWALLFSVLPCAFHYSEPPCRLVCCSLCLALSLFASLTMLLRSATAPTSRASAP